jgi:hypothetical protein
LYYLLWPLLSSYFRTVLRTIHPLKVLARKLMVFTGFLLDLIRDLWSWLRQPNRGKRKPSDAGAGRERWRRRKIRRAGLRKRLEPGRVLKAFLQLIRWAGRRGVTYSRHIAPLEFARAVSRAAPEHEHELRRSMELMEESLYSPHVLSREKLKLYLSLIRDVVRG